MDDHRPPGHALNVSPALRPAKVLHHIVQLLPPLAIGVLFVGVSLVVRSDSGPEATPTAVPVIVAVAPVPPIRILDLAVTPATLFVGGQGTLHNGICNDGREPITVKLYLGAEKVGGDPVLMANTVDLAGHNTPDGLLSRTIQPGCFGQEPATGPVDPRLTPGPWRLNLVMEVPGFKSITLSSPVFEVRPPP